MSNPATQKTNVENKYTEEFKNEVVEYRSTHTIKQTMEKYNISNHSVRVWCDPIQHEKGKANQRDFYTKNKDNPAFLEKYKKRNKEKYNNNKEKFSQQNKDYYMRNKDKVKEINKNWAKNNKLKDSQRRKKYVKTKSKNDPNFKIRTRLRTRMNLALFGEQYAKADKTFNLIGCSPSQLKSYLESLFQEGMSWDNYGVYGWHIDHIIPCASFDLTNPEQQRKCFHYTNLQPLWAVDNLKKGSSL